MSEWDDEIVIGEGVALNSGAAPVTMRMLSGVIDVALYLGSYIVILTSFADQIFSLSPLATNIVVISLTFVLWVAIPTVVETLTRGRSAGRIAVGLRVVRDDGGPISFRHAFTRALLGVFESIMSLGMVAITVSMFSTRGKRIGDILAGTYAMRTRGQQRALPPIMMPYGLQEWAANADMRRLPDGLALTARMFIGRAPTMHVHSRARLGHQLAAEFEKYVAPGPPPGTHPETFITAVLAARREREYAIAWRQNRRSEAETQKLLAMPYGIPDSDN